MGKHRKHLCPGRGRFYLQVGYDDFFDVGQSGWAGAKYIPSDKILKKVDDSLDFIDNIGTIFKTARDTVKVTNETAIDCGDQLTNIVKNIYELGERDNLNPLGLWLDPIPEFIYVEDLKKKYDYKPIPYFINPVIGEYDNPSEQQQGLLNLDMTKNTAIWGQVGSGKENLLSTIIWSCCVEHTPDEINIYIIDCGTEALTKFVKMPHVGDATTSEDSEKIVNMLTMVGEEIDRRKDLMSEYGGNYAEYLENSGKKLPIIAVIINNYEIFTETYSKLSDGIMNYYRDGFKYGIVFIVSCIATNAIKMKMLQSFSNKICLQIANNAYRDVVPAKKGLIPSKLFGRGLVAKDSVAYEFQTAIFCAKKDINKYILSASEQMSSAYKTRAKPILVLPDIVLPEQFEGDIETINSVPIGLKLEDVEPYKYDFATNKITNIVAKTLTIEHLGFIRVLIDYLHKIPNLIVNILDLEEVYKTVYSEDSNYYCENYDNALININNNIVKNKNSDVNIVTIIICMGEYKTKLSANGINIMNNLLNNMSEINNSSYIFIDELNSLKILQTEAWYQSNVDSSSGIWLGAGVGDQLLININDIPIDHRKMNFPCISFVIEKGEYTIIKHVTEGGKK